MKFYRDNKKITKKEAEAWLGKEKLASRIKDAKETFREDPYIENDWADGFGIRFDF